MSEECNARLGTYTETDEVVGLTVSDGTCIVRRDGQWYRVELHQIECALPLPHDVWKHTNDRVERRIHWDDKTPGAVPHEPTVPHEPSLVTDAEVEAVLKVLMRTAGREVAYAVDRAVARAVAEAAAKARGAGA